MVESRPDSHGVISRETTTKKKNLLTLPTSIHTGTIPILRHQRDWVGGVRKMAIIFADLQYYISMLTLGGWVGVSEKVQNYADVM